MKSNYYFVLFENHEQALLLRRKLKEIGYIAQISPTPREASHCCGVSLMIPEADYPALEDFFRESRKSYKSICKLEKDFDAAKDKYC